MRYSKLIVFLGSISSLVLMTVISALLGYTVTSFIPPVYTFYASIVHHVRVRHQNVLECLQVK